MPDTLSVFIVDDDPASRDALSRMMGIADYPVVAFDDATRFLDAYQTTWSGCVLIDAEMPGMGGLSLQQALQALGATLPVIIMSERATVATACAAFRAQALDFMEKPLDPTRLMANIAQAFASQRAKREAAQQRTLLEQRFAVLTARELEIMTMVVIGRHNRNIALELGISPRTVEVHKARIQLKLGVRSVPELVRLAVQWEQV